MPHKLKQIDQWFRRLRRRVIAGKTSQNRPLSPAKLQANSIVLRVGGKTMRWVFEHPFNLRFCQQVIAPWALPQAQRLDPGAAADFVVGVYLHDETILGSFADLPGEKFLLAGELETRYPKIDRTHSFVQAPQPADDATYVRYAPIMCFWTPPLSPTKTLKCSVVDSGRYPWRAELIHRLAGQIGDLDIFGELSGRKLGGYHGRGQGSDGNDKYLGIRDHCFYLSLERQVAEDYITEKLADAIMCEAVPIYRGAPNIALYAYDNSYIPVERLAAVDWQNWQAEYQRRLPAVRAQKEFFRTHLNLFSYFVRLTDKPELLASPRPITLTAAIERGEVRPA